MSRSSQWERNAGGTRDQGETLLVVRPVVVPFGRSRNRDRSPARHARLHTAATNQRLFWPPSDPLAVRPDTHQGPQRNEGALGAGWCPLHRPRFNLVHGVPRSAGHSNRRPKHAP
ncbi:hypothetical protein NDU88_004393 [Pleurodeles waltl]|uniref:Uncharacterized protein n=1 Tax=Pleurodeles waltl TaxID=8319 RepID=A0AAV7PFV8_PLEWA|nr:hypothetical protein NDU88_004393 [Pleurodeles waltl]